jgi:hypothetical protein
VEHAQRVPVIRAARLDQDRAVQCCDRLLSPACLMENCRELPQQIRAIGLLCKEPATIGLRTPQLSQPCPDKTFGFCSNWFQFAPPPTTIASLIIIRP